MAKWTLTNERMPATEGMYFVTREQTGVVWMMRYDPQQNESYPWNDGKGHIYSSKHMIAWMPVEYPIPFSMAEYQKEREAEKLGLRKKELAQRKNGKPKDYGGLKPLPPLGGKMKKQGQTAFAEPQTPANQSEAEKKTSDMVNKIIRDRRKSKK